VKKPLNANAALYGQGRRYAEVVARHSERGVGPRATLRRAAADLGPDVGTVRSAVAFKTVVDLVVGNTGPAAEDLILGGDRRLTPRQVARLARTHPDRQRYEVDQVARGRPLFAKPLPGVEPPFDTLGYDELLSRVERFGGLIGWVADGLSATPADGWPSVAKLHAISSRNASIRDASAALQTVLKGSGTRAATAPVQRPARPRERRPSDRAPCDPGNAYALVSAARGVMEKNLRDAPRLLRESPPTAKERASILAGLRRLDATAARLSRITRGHVRTTTYPVTPGPPVGRGRAAAEAAGEPRAVAVVDQPEGPADWDGTYIVTFRLDADADAEDVGVGALGTFRFPAGFYCYVGSMFGPGGVRARTGRHRTRVKTNKKWNVDFLTPHAGAVEVWWTHDPVRRECSWSAALGASAAFDCPVPEFGARDCRKAPPLRIGAGVYRCPAHLYRSLPPPDVHDFARRLGRLVPGHGVIYRQRLGRAEIHRRVTPQPSRRDSRVTARPAAVAPAEAPNRTDRDTHLGECPQRPRGSGIF